MAAEAELAHSWRVAETASYIEERGFSVVTLQLPDELLAHATRLEALLAAELAARGLSVQVRGVRGRAGGARAHRRTHPAGPAFSQYLAAHRRAIP